MSKLIAKHGHDHRANGPDPIPGTGGLQFDLYPQTGDWLYVRTTGKYGDTHPSATFAPAGLVLWSATGGFHALSGSDGSSIPGPANGADFWVDSGDFGLDSWSSAFGSHPCEINFSSAGSFEMVYLWNGVLPMPTIANAAGFVFLQDGSSLGAGSGHLRIYTTNLEIEGVYTTAPAAELAVSSVQRDLIMNTDNSGRGIFCTIGASSHEPDNFFAINANDSSASYLEIHDAGGTVTYHIKTGAHW